MKKLFAILLIVLAVTPLFAFEGQIGATLGYQNAWLFEIEGNDTGDVQSRTLVMSVNGANYFGSNGGFGVEYGIGMTNLLNTKVENLTVDDEEFDPGLILNLGASYRYGITDMIGISAGLGLSVGMDWANGQDIVYIQKDVDLFGGGNLSPEGSMKKLFGMVKAQAETNPKKSAILYIENFEYFSYGENLSEYHEKAMSQLIREMNKAQEQGMNIVVMGSMNNPEYIGDATSKSFKFIDQIEVESPGYNKEARNEIINYYIKKKGIKLAGDSEEQQKIKSHINMLTERCSYIEILTLLDKAKNVAKERKHKNADNHNNQ